MGGDYNRLVVGKILVLGWRQTQIFCFVSWDALGIYKNPIVKTIFFTRKNNRSLTLFKHFLFRELANNSSALFSDFAFKIEALKICSEPFVNRIKILKTPNPTLFV